MSDVINRTTLQFLRSVNDPLYPEPTWKANPDMSQVAGVDPRFWKWDAVNDRPIPMTAGEQATAIAAALSAARDGAAERLTQAEDITRAFMLLVLDELNAHTAKVNAILDAIDAAASLAGLKTAIGLLADLPTRTEQQLRTAIRNKLGT